MKLELLESRLNAIGETMLDILKNTIPKIPELLREPDNWDSLIINKRKPHTYRVFTQLDNIRVCLHKFDMCSQNEAFWHPHPGLGRFWY